MPAAETRLKILDMELEALGENAMLLSGLDGYLTGLLLCPAPIPPVEWLPGVWGEPGEADAVVVADSPAFQSREHLDDVIAAVMAHYNAIARVLNDRPQAYEPVFDTDEETGEIVWETWAAGFAEAMDLRFDAWAPLFADESAAETDLTEEILAMGQLSMFVAVADGRYAELGLAEADAEAVARTAAQAIPEAVLTLNAWRRRQRPDPSTAASGAKIGRNDPCPCGSGKKYKKCCGAS